METELTWFERKIQEIKDCNKNNPEREKEFIEQFTKNGFSDLDTFSLDGTFAAFMGPLLKRYKEIYMDKMTIDETFIKDIDLMIEAFELMADGKHIPGGNKMVMEKINKGLDAFRQNIFKLWW